MTIKSRPRVFSRGTALEASDGLVVASQKVRMTVLGVVFVGLFLSFSADAHAVFTLSVTPRRGGQHIRFEGAKPGTYLRNEEVTLKVTSDRGAQYRISQALYQPLTNEFGNTIPQGAFIVFSPSNPLGT